MTSQYRISIAAILIRLVSLCTVAGADDKSFIVFDGPAPPITPNNPNVDYELQPSSEKYFVYLPSNYDEQTPFGLVVFTDSEDTFDRLPLGWATAFRDHKLLFIAAQNAGNDQAVARRLGLAVLGATEMIQHHKIDPARIYAAGFSGGARMSGMLGFFQPTIFRGTVQICGADFYEAVPKVATQTAEVPPGDYGLLSATPDEIAAAKTVRFTFITGDNDFRYADIQDIFHGGFEKSAFKAKLIEVPGMSHRYCGGSTLDTALTFLDQTPVLPLPQITASAAPAALPAGPTISLTSSSHTVIIPVPDGFSETGNSTPDHRIISLNTPAGAIWLHLQIAGKNFVPDFNFLTIQHWADADNKLITDRFADRLTVKPELLHDPRFLLLLHYQFHQSPTVLKDITIRWRHIGNVVVHSEIEIVAPNLSAVQNQANQALNAFLTAQMVVPPTPAVAEHDVPWLSPDLAKWPQILMNNYFGPPSSRISAGSSFLLKLPNGAVVAVTARHVLGDKPIQDPEIMDPTWTMWPPHAPGKKNDSS
jgi:Esterase PHB depolymerase